MRYWLHMHNMLPEDAVEMAVLAEQLGFEGVLGDDHWFMPAASGDADPNERAVLPWDLKPTPKKLRSKPNFLPNERQEAHYQSHFSAQAENGLSARP
jgi:alkanesulfonate monooxygenase SsuD/methylene tetrahydromethanopterin reductase-like flavin-dependent oxidoreductase (luciferase family)